MRRGLGLKAKPLWQWLGMRMSLLAIGAVILIAFSMWLKVTISDWLTIQSMPPEVRVEFTRLMADPSTDVVKLRTLFLQYYPIENMLPGIANKDWWTLAGLVVLAIPIIIFFGLLFSRPLSRQFSDIAKGARRVARGDFETRLPVGKNTPDELKGLVSDFNTMTLQLERYELEVSESSAMIAHELRTPLNAAMGRVQGMIDDVFPRDIGQLEMVSRQLNQLNKLVNDLHLLSLARAGQLVLNKARFSVRRLVDERLAWFSSQFEEASINVIINMPEHLQLWADRDRIGQVVSILLDNALRYSLQGRELSISATATPEHIKLSFADRGPGFVAEDISSVFDRFWRADRSRARYSGGSGLGLSIARAICLEHGGTISAANRPDGGAIIWLEIPVNPGANTISQPK
jgi:signal transduction histidine kinase